MTDATSTTSNTPGAPHSLGSSIHSLSGKWGWFVALGVLFALTGAYALVAVVPATLVSAIWIGAFLLVAGIGETIAAFQFKEWGRFTLWLLMGLAYIAAGIITFVYPMAAAVSLTLIVGIAMLVAGVVRTWLGFNMKDSAAWGLVVFSGVISILLGVMILAQWPASGLYVLGIFLGVDLLFSGAGWISTGLTIRRLTHSHA
ncbi:MAG: HdeD family acid-resistance protein [Proteobacteria bacterium]|nr:HdeD family acid-resistance protein [Pseudomonadota bacterium]